MRVHLDSSAVITRALRARHGGRLDRLDADLMLTYDTRLADACRENGLAVAAPS